MFEPNKYTTWYFSIISIAKNRVVDGYSERHHIIPKSLGGGSKSCNIVHLTAREHFICHWLLIKMTTGENKRKMSYALWTMTRGNSKHHRVISSGQYEIARRHFSSTVKKRKTSIETRRKQSESQKNRPSHSRSKDNLKNAGKSTGIWIVTHPNGKSEQIINLAQFCRNNNISQGNLCNGGKSKGFSAIRVGTIVVKNPELLPEVASSYS